MAGLAGLYKVQIGEESTLGTEVAATTILRGDRGFINDESPIEFPPESVGRIGGIGRNYTLFQDGTFQMPEAPVTFEQLPYFLNAGIQAVTGSQDGTGSGYIYTYPLPGTSVLTPDTYTIEAGDNQQAEIMTGCFAEEIVITGGAQDVWRRAVTWRGWPGGPTTFTSSLTVPAVDEINFGKTSLYIDNTSGSFGGTQVSDSFLSFELTIGAIYEAKWHGNGSNLYYTNLHMLAMPEITLNFTLEHDSVAVAERANRRANTPRLIQIAGLGPAVSDNTGATYNNKQVIIQLPGSYSEPEVQEANDSSITVPFTFKWHYDSTENDEGQIIVVNELSSLP